MAKSLLSPAAFARSGALLRQGPAVERAMFAFHFEGGSAEAAREALALHQNADGGYHGLEPDIGLKASSVLCTCHALHYLRELGTPAAHPAVERARAYLAATFDPVRGVWPIIPPHGNTEPHAPWWHHAEGAADQWQGYVDNPRPDVLACLLTFPAASTRSLVEQTVAATLARLRADQAPIEMHGLLCYTRLHQAPNLPASLKVALERTLPRSIAAAVERDPAKWSGYGLRPLLIAPDAASPWKAIMPEAIEANLDYMIETQESDGAWSPFWNWGDAFPDAWPSARRRWQAVLTLAALHTLRSYERLG
ncbi:MAG: hypothetical protein JSR48_05480 [Verrucomicrobia bacterium]|nr:hypothetical protein [Verrucomicrobiota bacterium]